MNPRLRSISLFALVSLFAMVAMAQAEWVDLADTSGETPSIVATEQDGQTTVLEITVPGFDAQTVMIDGQQCTKVVLPGHVQMLEQGLPELPYITSSLIIPGVGTPAIEIISSEYRDIVTNPIVPSKGNLLRTVDPNSIPYVFGDAYQGGIFPGTQVEVGEPYIVRDFRGVSVRVYPFRYDADRGVLMALERMTVEVTTSGSGGINQKHTTQGDQIDPQFASIYGQAFDNYNPASRYVSIGTEGPLLVICYDAFVGSIAPFVEWKMQKGMDVELLTTADCGGTVAGIQDAISTRYFSEDGLTYVVLVGDKAQIPCYSGTYEGADDDTKYVSIEGSDLYPDAFISRISASGATEVQLQVNKFVRYEKTPDIGGDWYHMATGIASNEGSPSDIERANWLRDDLLGYTFSDVDQIYQGQGGSTAGITAAINEGRSLVNYIGHGSGTSWSNVPFSNSNVHALSNGWAQPWIIDVSCLNGDFSMPECFAEAWLRAGTVSEPDGAIGMYSASTSTPWVPPCVMQAETIDLLVGDVENVLGALCFSGIMAVIDEYGPGSGTQLVEQYNIFGDCSLVVRTDTPTPMAVTHLPVVPLFSPFFGVDTGVPGATAALYSDGVLHGVGVTDAAGHVDIELVNPVMIPGEVTLTISGYNLETYVQPLMAVVPANIRITPLTIPVGVETTVTVAVTDPDDGTGIADLNIFVEGYGVAGLSAVTDAAGEAVFQVNPVYGETLSVRGRETGATYDIFTEDLPVTGATTLTNAAIAAEVSSIGLVDALTPHIEGTVTAGASESDLTLFLTGGGLDVVQGTAGSQIVVNVTPTELENVTAALAKTGYQVHLAEIQMVEAFGSVAGTVVDADAGQTPVAGARVFGFNAGDDPNGTPLFDLISSASGDYIVAEDLPVGFYDIYVTKFGYLQHAGEYFVMYGANDFEIALNQAPSGVLTGTVTDSEDASLLEATVRIYRTDTMELFMEVTGDPATGVFTTGTLPYFDYQVVVKAYRHIPQTVNVTINAPSLTMDFVLEPTNGDLLLINDNSRHAMVSYPAKLDKLGRVISPACVAPAGRSYADMVIDLEDYGYNVTIETPATTDPATWSVYDMVLISCSDNTGTLDAAGFTDQIRTFVLNGGHLLLEGGEVAYDQQWDTAFCQDVLHINDWNHDSSGDVTVAEPSHFVMSIPNEITGPIGLTYTGYGDADAVTVTPDAVKVGSWSNYTTDGSVICYDTNAAPQGGQIVSFLFDYSALAVGTERAELLQNAVNWLITPEFGDCSISGTVEVAMAGDNSDVVLTLNPGDFQIVTDASGDYSFDGLFAGDYNLTVTREGWASAAATYSLDPGMVLTGVDFTLNPIVSSDFCDSPDLAIPDHQQYDDPDSGIYVTLPVHVHAPFSSLDLFVDVTHTYVGDLIIDLISPQGTIVRVHSNQGSGGADLVGWYPADMTPFHDFTAFIGEDIYGDWTMRIVDIGEADTGTLNEWCLRLFYVLDATPVADRLPSVLSLDGNYPNPFNPATTIMFSVPAQQRVDLAVYNIRGQRVATLVDHVLEAGRHEVTWRGADDRGRAVASGIYFYRLVSDGEAFTSKMVLLK